MKIVKGDATCPLEAGTKILCHVVNDSGKWGKGFVMAVSKRWPTTREAYLDWHQTRQNFGLGDVLFQPVSSHVVVAHMLAQRGLIGRSNQVPLRYDALRKCLKTVAAWADNNCATWPSPLTVVMPKIGTGLAGGNWTQVSQVVLEELCDRGLSVTVYEL